MKSHKKKSDSNARRKCLKKKASVCSKWTFGEIMDEFVEFPWCQFQKYLKQFKLRNKNRKYSKIPLHIPNICQFILIKTYDIVANNLSVGMSIDIFSEYYSLTKWEAMDFGLISLRFFLILRSHLKVKQNEEKECGWKETSEKKTD